jgi:(2Fe-2S) ferredoxin
LSERAASARDQRGSAPAIVIQVGSATCEHAAGSLEVLDEFRKHVVASERRDILLRQTGCTGRCSREPIVGVLIPGQLPVKYERVNRGLVHDIFTSHIQKGQPLLDKVLDGPVERVSGYELLVCSSLAVAGGESVQTPLTERLREAGFGADQLRDGRRCLALCIWRKRSLHPCSALTRFSPDPARRNWTRLSASISAREVVESLRVQEGW